MVWFAWFAYVRITTPPTAFAERADTDDRETDELSEELAEALRGLMSPTAPLTTSAPAAAAWPSWWPPGWLVTALTEAWGPANNTVQQAGVSYVTGAASNALGRIVAVVDEQRQTGRPTITSADSGATVWSPFGQSELAVVALTFRARYRASDKDDLAGALQDLRVAFLLAGPERHAFGNLTAVCQHELGCMLQEKDIPPDEAARMIAFLRDELSLSVTSTAEHILHGHGDVERILDKYYTRDESGDGWLVLSAAAEIAPSLTGRVEFRSGFWNIFSPLFHGRAMMRQRLTHLSEELRCLDELSCQEAIAQLTRRGAARPRPSVLDGPLTGMTAGVHEGSLRWAFYQVTQVRAAVVMLALSAFKHEHGHYPATLNELVPAFLDEIPLDAFAHEPFVYERLGDSRYDLRSPSQLPDDLRTTWPVSLPGFEASSYLPRRTLTGTKGE